MSSQRPNDPDNRSALRGNPSFVWRAGQERRLEMIRKWIPGAPQRKVARVLVDGCGVGMYVRALQPYAFQIYGIDIEPHYLREAVQNAPGALLQLAACEQLPYPDDFFDLILSHEVLEHVQDDAVAVAEMIRTLRSGGRAVVFAPNRFYPFETHGHYWRGRYYFGNTPLINYLPDRWRDPLAPHVRTYSAAALRHLFIGQPVRICCHARIYPGYDNIIRRYPTLGRWLRWLTYSLEQSPLAMLGLSHFLVVEKTSYP